MPRVPAPSPHPPLPAPAHARAVATHNHPSAPLQKLGQCIKDHFKRAGVKESVPNGSNGGDSVTRAMHRLATHFFGRENALRHLRDALRNGQNPQFNGPRHIGKSSLLLATHHRLKSWGFDHAKLA